MGLFKKAVKEESKLRLALAGPSGSGKTYTALAVATALGAGPVAVVDTESGSASKYADLFDFDVAEMTNFHPQNYIKAIHEAVNAGYGVVILDSLSHAWSGTGGLLDIVDNVAKRSQSKNSYMAWKEGTPIQNALIDAILQSPIHIIATMRSKIEYVLETDSRGKNVPRKVGMAAIQRDGMEYEFDVLLQMTLENEAIVEKTRCPELSGRIFEKPSADLAGILAEWLTGAEPTPKPATNESKAEPAPTIESLADVEELPIEPTATEEFEAIPSVPAGQPSSAGAQSKQAAQVQSAKPVNGERPDWKSPTEAYQWSIENGFAKDMPNAVGSWNKVIKKTFGKSSVQPSQLQEAFDAYHTHQMAKAEASQAIDENGNRYTVKNGIRNYSGVDARRELERGLNEIESTHHG